MFFRLASFASRAGAQWRDLFFLRSAKALRANLPSLKELELPTHAHPALKGGAYT